MSATEPLIKSKRHHQLHTKAQSCYCDAALLETNMKACSHLGVLPGFLVFFKLLNCPAASLYCGYGDGLADGHGAGAGDEARGKENDKMRGARCLFCVIAFHQTSRVALVEFHTCFSNSHLARDFLRVVPPQESGG